MRFNKRGSKVYPNSYVTDTEETSVFYIVRRSFQIYRTGWIKNRIPVGCSFTMPTVQMPCAIVELCIGTTIPVTINLISINAHHIYTQIKILVTQIYAKTISKIRSRLPIIVRSFSEIIPSPFTSANFKSPGFTEATWLGAEVSISVSF